MRSKLKIVACLIVSLSLVLLSTWKKASSYTFVINLTNGESPATGTAKTVENLMKENEITEIAFINQTSSEKLKNTSNCGFPKNFAYVKTHKTGSTTVYKVMVKYAQEHNLKTTVKTPNPFLGGYPGRIQPHLIYVHENRSSLKVVQRNQQFVLFDHFRYNGTALRSIMPKDTIYLSILRKPWNNFQSAFYYYYRKPRLKTLFKANCFQFPYFHIAKGKRIDMIEYLTLAHKELNQTVPWYFRSKNYQAHDLGLDPLLEDDHKIEKELQKLGQEFNLVMITEYMDESMVLLKKLFCMSWTDIAFIDDGKKHDYKPYDIGKNAEAFKIFKKIYQLDIALYDFFNQTFWKKVDEYGREKMRNDVARLRRMRLEISQKIGNKKVVSRKQRSLVDMLHEKTFKSMQINYSRTKMIQILRNKISLQQPVLNPMQVNQIAEYMVDNGGGCPV